MLEKRNILADVEYYYYRSIIVYIPQIKKAPGRPGAKKEVIQIRGGYKVLNTLTT